MKRKPLLKTQPVPIEATQRLPVRQLKARRGFGIKQLAAALEMVGTGELFIDQQFAIGVALKLLKQPFSLAERSDLMMDGMEYLAERGLLAIELPPKSKHGHVDMIIRLPAAEVSLTAELIAAGLKPRRLGADATVTEFRGRLSRDSDLLAKVRSAGGTVALIENPHAQEIETSNTNSGKPPTVKQADDCSVEEVVGNNGGEIPMKAEPPNESIEHGGDGSASTRLASNNELAVPTAKIDQMMERSDASQHVTDKLIALVNSLEQSRRLRPPFGQ